MRKGGEKVCLLPFRALLEMKHDAFSENSLERTHKYGPIWLQRVLRNKMVTLETTDPAKTQSSMTKDEKNKHLGTVNIF